MDEFGEEGSHKLWGTQLDDHGHYQAIDLQ
jgi:hypothetical protein